MAPIIWAPELLVLCIVGGIYSIIVQSTDMGFPQQAVFQPVQGLAAVIQ